MAGNAGAAARKCRDPALGVGHGQRAEIVAAAGGVFGEEIGTGVSGDVADGPEALLDQADGISADG